jgi:hypothetical protein
MSLVDVVVPCYRYGHFLRECVSSVLSQSLRDVRVLIIDDCSPDSTAEVAGDLVKHDRRVTFLRHTTNKGHIATYNEGIAWASAAYLVVLSADDYLLPDSLRRSTQAMNSHPEVGFTFGKVLTLDETGTTQKRPALPHPDEGDDWHILSGLEFIKLSAARCIVRAPAAVVRTSLQKRLGGYRPELPHSGDMEMWLRLAAHASVAVLGSFQAVYRRHTTNMSLGYTAKSWLPDLQQRKAALDCFFETSSGVLPEAEQLRSTLFWSLGRDAVEYAHGAFNDGNLAISKQISDFALTVCPRVKGTLPWTRLACKRYLGYQASSTLLPLFAGGRRIGSQLARLAHAFAPILRRIPSGDRGPT